MSSIILLLACILAFMSCESSDFLELKESDFDYKLTDIDTALVMFYAPWCMHRKRHRPKFAKAAVDFKNDNDGDLITHSINLDCIFFLVSVNVCDVDEIKNVTD